MTVGATNSTQGSSGSGASGPSGNAIGANGSSDPSQMFTTLLIAQIKNQDPTQPTDPTQYVTQLAQLSQLQSLQTLTTQGTTSAGMLQGLQTLTLGAAVGTQVSASTGKVVLGTTPVKGQVTLANADSAVSLVITSAAGVQQRIALGAHQPGDVEFSINPTSLGLPPGTYSVSVDTSSGETPDVQIAGTINRVRVASQGVMVDVSNLGEIPSTEITSFEGRTAGGN